MDEIEINIFEYELAGYKQKGNSDTEPSVYTTSLIAKPDKKDCPFIRVGKSEAGEETRSCDVLEGILDTTAPTDGKKIVDTFAQEITITPESGLPALHLSDLLYITTVYPTKITPRPPQTEFIPKINPIPTLPPFYEDVFVPNLLKAMLTDLVPSWESMVQNVQKELDILKAKKLDAVPKDLAKLLTEKMKLDEDTTSLSSQLTDAKEVNIINLATEPDIFNMLIRRYTMVKVHTPAEDEQYITVGDLHGSLGTFVRLLYRWKLLGYINDKGLLQKQNGTKLNILFLGDLSDRGVWGYEIYYTLFYLYLVNKGNENGEFYITRGNHEEISVNIKEGFFNDLQTIFLNKTYDSSSGTLTQDGDANFYHDYINIILSYLPSAHQLMIKNNKFLYLAHGGYPLRLTKDCKDPTVLPLSDQSIYFYDLDIKLDTPFIDNNTIRWNDFYSIENTVLSIEHRSCGLGLNAIEQAKKLGYSFTIRAHQDLIANTKVLLAPEKGKENPTTAEDAAIATEIDEPKKKALIKARDEKILNLHGPKNIHDIELFKLCPDGTKSNCKDSIGTLTMIAAEDKIILNNEKYIKNFLPVLTLSTNTDFKRDLFRDSYVMVKFKKTSPPPPPPPPKTPPPPLTPRDSCLAKLPPTPSGLFRELQNLFTDVHNLDKSMNDLIQKLEILNVLDKCTDIKTHEGTICDAQIALDNALKEYKNNVEDLQEPGSAPPIAAMPVIKDKQYKNSQINGKTIKGSLQDMQKRSKCDKKYLSSDISALVAYGFLNRSGKSEISLPNDVTYDDIYEFIEWTTSTVRKGYPYLIAKWLLQMRSNLLKDIENNSNPDQTQRVLREEVAKIESSLSIGNVTNEFLDPRKLSNASGFIAPPPPPPPPPPKSKLKPDQTNIYYKQLFEALNTLIEAYITFINKLQECIDAPPTKEVWSCDPATNKCVSYNIPASLELVAGQFESQAECDEKCKKAPNQTVWSCDPVKGECFSYEIPASATPITDLQFLKKEDCETSCKKGGGGGPPVDTREVWVCNPLDGKCSKQTINLPAGAPIPLGLYEKEDEPNISHDHFQQLISELYIHTYSWHEH